MTPYSADQPHATDRLMAAKWRCDAVSPLRQNNPMQRVSGVRGQVSGIRFKRGISDGSFFRRNNPVNRGHKRGFRESGETSPWNGERGSATCGAAVVGSSLSGETSPCKVKDPGISRGCGVLGERGPWTKFLKTKRFLAGPGAGSWGTADQPVSRRRHERARRNPRAGPDQPLHGALPRAMVPWQWIFPSGCSASPGVHAFPIWVRTLFYSRPRQGRLGHRAPAGG